jgi:anti-sigma B factor antagonist
MVPAQRAAPGAAGLAVVTLPAEIDTANAGRAGEDLRAGLDPGARIVMAGMPGTRFCGTPPTSTRWGSPPTRPSRTVPTAGGAIRVVLQVLCQGAAVDYRAPATEPVVVGFPDQFDVSNAGDLAEQMRAAIAPGVSAVVADLTTTAFCDSAGLRIIVLAHDWAKADNVKLRLAVPPGPTLALIHLVGLDQLLPIYPSLDQALAGGPIPKEDVSRG